MTQKITYKKHYRVELADTLSQHWYHVWETSLATKKKKETEKYLGVFPSATTILNAYPQSAHLTKWIAEQGWNEAQEIKSAAGVRGTRVHTGIEALLGGALLRKPDFSLDEFFRLTTFVRWYEAYKPEIIALEMPVFSKKGGYAGRLDCIARVNGQVMILDWKTSSSIHENFPLQFAAYATAIEEATDIKIEATAAIQMGAKKKDGYRFVLFPDWHDHYKVFQHVRAVWQYDVFDSKKGPKEPPVLELPAELQLNTGKAEVVPSEKK